MPTTAVSILEQRLAEQIGDYIEVIVTTAINADTSIVSTNLKAYDGGRDDYFIDWWCYITDKANIETSTYKVNRQVSDYATSGGTLTIRGAVLLDDSANLATIRLHRYNRDLYLNAINDAIREIYPALYKDLDVIELVTGNILPNSHFRDWTASTIPDKYSLSNATATALATAGNYRGGAKSANVVAMSNNGYMLITSNDYPRLLDLMGRTASAYVWAKPEVATDATIVIYTLQADGTAQTLTSSTANPAGEFTLLKLEDQLLNDDLVLIEVRFKVATDTKYVYFDHARVTGHDMREYMLPIDFRDGDIDEMHVQTKGYSDLICDDLHPRYWERVFGYERIGDGTDTYLYTPDIYTSSRLIRLKGRRPLSTVSAYTDTIEIADEQVNLFIAYAKYKLYQAIEGPVASEDIRRYELQSAKAYAEYRRLLSHTRMPSKPKTMRLNTW